MAETRTQLLASFSNRLVSALKERGLSSSRSSSGVKVAELSLAINCSSQMARRYALGKALPDYETILAMSSWLDVSPGWLLFGDEGRREFGERELLGIDYDFFRHILVTSIPLIKQSHDSNEVSAFIVDLIYDASHLKADSETIRKMVDMSISSATKFGSSRQYNGYDKPEKICVNS